MKKSILYLCSLCLILFTSGCSVTQAGLDLIQTKEPEPNPSLPKVENIKTIADLESVAFEWSVSKDPNVKGYYLFRNAPQKEGEGMTRRIIKINDRYSTHFVDKDLQPETTYFYQMSTFDAEQKASEKTEITKVTTTKLDPVSFISAVSNYPRRIKILWRPHPNPRINGYSLERATGESDEWEEITEVRERLLASYIDHDLKDGQKYRYKIRAITYDDLLSPPSKVAEATTKPLPVPVKGLKATRDRPKMIELTWKANPEKDIDGYNIYRASEKDGSYSVQGTTKETRFEHTIEEDGVEHWYKITAVDIDELESLLPETGVSGMTLSIPETPKIVWASIQDQKATLKWEKTDSRAVSFIVTKKSQEWLDVKTGTINVAEESFTDVDIVPGVKYRYSISAVDKYGLVSEPSAESELLLPASIKKE